MPVTLLPPGTSWTLSDLAVVPVGRCQALHHQRDQDLQTAPTDANRSNLPIPRHMKSNKAAKSTTYPSSWAKAKSALQAIPTITAALTLPLRELFEELRTISPSLLFYLC